jgi:hypothetical protein
MMKKRNTIKKGSLSKKRMKWRVKMEMQRRVVACWGTVSERIRLTLKKRRKLLTTNRASMRVKKKK